MRKIVIALSSILILLMIIFGINYTIELDDKEININGTTYALTVDGESVNSIPTTGNYYLTSYTCENGSIVTWDKNEHDLYINAIDENGDEYIQIDSCTLEFSTKPLLNTMKVGDYVAYEGDPNNGCLLGEETVISTNPMITSESGNSCKGENANQPAGAAGENGLYGYCQSDKYNYTTYGWRIAYVDEGKVNLISAGSPKCVSYNSSLDEEALKFCNATYVDGGICSSSNARSLSNEEFEKITYEISGTSSKIVSEVANDLTCLKEFSNKRCGYGNDLIDNGGIYIVDEVDKADTGLNIEFSPADGAFVLSNSILYNGLRPVITLSSSVYVTGGSGTMEDPWEIAIDTN